MEDETAQSMDRVSAQMQKSMRGASEKLHAATPDSVRRGWRWFLKFVYDSSIRLGIIYPPVRLAQYEYKYMFLNSYTLQD